MPQKAGRMFTVQVYNISLSVMCEGRHTMLTTANTKKENKYTGVKTNAAVLQIEIQTQYLSLCYVKVTRSHTKAPIKLRRQLNENFTDILDICQIRAGPVFCGANPKYAAD